VVIILAPHKQKSEQEILSILSYNHKWFERLMNTFLGFSFRDVLTITEPTSKKLWAKQGFHGGCGINQYIKVVPTSYSLLEEIEFRAKGRKDLRMLDLCCNIGRHSQYLFDKGFSNLYGVDVNTDCGKYQDKYFPQLAKKGTYFWLPVEEYLPTVKDNFFDIVFTHGLSISHITSRYNLPRDLARITRKYVIMANVKLTDGPHSRFWLTEFQRYGLVPIKLLQPEKEWCPKSAFNRAHALLVLKKIPKA